MIPITHPAQKIDQLDSENKDMGQSYMFQEKVINNLLLLAVGVAKQFRVSMRCPKSRSPIQIIVFYKLELIIFVSQSLTLSTASLVYHKNHCSIFLSYTFNFNTVSHTRPQGTRLLILDLGQLLKSLHKKRIVKNFTPPPVKISAKTRGTPLFYLSCY